MDNSIDKTVLRLMKDGLTFKQAIQKIESIMHTKVQEDLKSYIRGQIDYEMNRRDIARRANKAK